MKTVFVLPVSLFLFLTSMISSNAMADENPGNKVLRHAVFLSFNDDASDQDINKIVEAFKELPSKIDSIIDFKWGLADKDAKMSAGFSHAFLLTFKDEAGREVYLPHPDHKAFVVIIGPHLKDVFVIDYWGETADNELENEFKHPVFFKFSPDATDQQIKDIEAGFAELETKIDTVKHFEWGRNNSPETHDDGFTHCFMVTFENAEGLEVYSPHPAHQAFVKTLGPVQEFRVIDFPVQK